MISIKTKDEIQKMRLAGQKAAHILQRMISELEEGMSTYELDQMGFREMKALGVKSACYQYPSPNGPYPCYTCISVNDELVHGIASKKRILKQGDTVSIDVSLFYDGFAGDTTKTIVVGQIADQRTLALIQATEEALYEGISKAQAGHHIGDISSAIQTYLEKRSFQVVRDFVGHGVGRKLHEEPPVPNYGKPQTGPVLKLGMTLAIEPMATQDNAEVVVDSDGWTVRSKDKKPCAHFEHTILITEEHPEILTFPQKITS